MIGALPPAVDAALLAAWVFGEDTYRDNGISRWDAYRSPGGALAAMFAASIVLLVTSSVLLATLGRGGARRPFRWVALLAALGVVLLVTPTIIGFGTN